MANYLGYEFIDAATVIFFDDGGNFDTDKTNEVLGACLEKVERAVIPGFYGAHYDGRVKTFSRGGSDAVSYTHLFATAFALQNRIG